ncbi:AcrR family transcriptional regulator [Pararhizobium capsulatum DSM 1112]|uniref:AcrR family transcriptional regulator n=1 Tax=Pararhizobium capsulatum DSM 1112 TaxID=1121113 RepID=A0ABU0C0A7_9HYPH|nr:TetR family transcriptional regulator [Pararhizobium capsulatum]MDQ0323958.1 AcrR family transcriptional regulator [Pararhizobium capsulatum DSM 1112]
MIKTISQIDLSSALRRLPTQQRSREKVRSILEAADRLLPEYGYEAIVQSPWPIVDASGVTAGVFYNYFENGEAVLEALSLMYAEQTRAAIDELAAENFQSWEVAIDAVNDRFAEFYSQPTVRELWLNNRLTQTAKLAGNEANSHIHQTVIDLIERSSGHDIKFSPSGAVILANLGDKLLRFIFEQPEDQRPELMDELKNAMKSYAATFIGR